MSSSQQYGPPYLPSYQILGEIPTIIPDVPINAIFLILFLMTGIGHGVVVYNNLLRGRKFVISFVIAIFCLNRVIATSLRLAWACHPSNLHLDIAALVFLYAGVVFLYLINLTFAQRLLRAQHPQLGWIKPVSAAFISVWVIVIVTFICAVAGVITSFYSGTKYGTHAARELEKFGSTMLAIVATLPLLITGVSTLARRHPHIRMTKTTDKFGEGSMRSKVVIVVTSSVLLAISAWFRAGAILTEPVPLRASRNSLDTITKPGYLSKACFYVFIFTIEISVCILWLIMRVDKRFFTPDGAHGPHSYANGFVFAGEPGNEKKRVSAAMSSNPSESSRPNSVRSAPALETIDEAADVQIVSPISPRSSWAMSIASKEKERQAKLENRISWGGVSREDVHDTTDEGGKVVRYQPFASSWIGGDTAADAAVEGTDKELGYDPESGKYAVRPISSMNSIRSSRPRSVIYES